MLQDDDRPIVARGALSAKHCTTPSSGAKTGDPAVINKSGRDEPCAAQAVIASELEMSWV
jgi:hypothetical protein